MEEHILFIDETLKTSNNPYFCLSGICVKRDYYEDIMTKEVNDVKKRHFFSTDAIFHYSEMNNKKGVFSIFTNGEKRDDFWSDYVATIRKMEFVSFGVYCNQTIMSTLYKTKDIKIYNIAFLELINNFLHYLKSVDGLGSICVESRLLNENADLQNIYYNMMHNGTRLFSILDFNKYLSSIGFTVKGDNCIGLQIADISPSALLRKINLSKDFNNIGDVYTRKLYCYGTESQNILGMKNIL